MTLAHLQTFVAVADAGGLRRAADRAHLSQPAISRQLHALEAELGVRLFDLIRRRVQLTSAGEDLLQRSRRLLIDAEEIGERARALKSGQTGVLRVGAMPQLIESLMVPFLRQYRRRHPGVEVRLTEDGGLRLRMRLERGDVHFATIPEADERFESRLLAPSGQSRPVVAHAALTHSICDLPRPGTPVSSSWPPHSRCPGHT